MSREYVTTGFVRARNKTKNSSGKTLLFKGVEQRDEISESLQRID